MAKRPGNKNVINQDKDIHCGHDGVTRGFLDEKEVAASFLKEYLPAEITRELDFRTLKVSKDTFVDRKISRYFADILYETKLKHNRLFIYLLFEHKSAEEKMVGFQFLQYMVKIWEKYLKQNRDAAKLPPIFPILIYHGEKEWKVETRFLYLFDVPTYLEKYIPEDQFRESIEQILEEGGDLMATLAQQWKEQGKDEGIEIGIEIGKEEGSETTKWTVARKSLKMGLDIASIVEITGLPEEKIRLLASKMNLKKTENQ
ncbi:MAG: Rpn family recombination-promoting nuclease/putative transposase [Candidatus Aminicenantes bacterium]|jgi:predicted transposase YdaD